MNYPEMVDGGYSNSNFLQDSYHYEYGGRISQYEAQIQIQIQFGQDQQSQMRDQFEDFYQSFKRAKNWINKSEKEQKQRLRHEMQNRIQMTESNPIILKQIQQKVKFKIIDGHRIKDINFFKLKVVNLTSNYILSVQGISYMHSPNLQSLILTDNMISSLRSLRRCLMPKLKRLAIDVNQMTDLQSLCQLLAPQLEQLKIDRYYWTSNGQSLSFLTKLQTSRLNNLCVFKQRKFRIFTSSLQQCIGQKYSKISFNY